MGGGNIDIKLIFEIIGYIGSALVIISMLMTSVKKLRTINLVGSALSFVYALIIRSYPTAIINGSLIIINIYQLYKLRKAGKSYDLVCPAPGDTVVDYLLDYYKDDIGKYFPGFSAKAAEQQDTFLVCCQSVPAGVMKGRREGEEFFVSLDYSTPVYRDCSVGTFLYNKLPELGIKKLVFNGGSEEHKKYLTKMGFQSPNGSDFVKEL